MYNRPILRSRSPGWDQRYNVCSSKVLKADFKISQSFSNGLMPSVINNFYELGEFRLDPQSRVLRRYREIVPLTPKAFEILLLLVRNEGHLITNDELMRAVWPDSFVEESNLTQT